MKRFFLQCWTSLVEPILYLFGRKKRPFRCVFLKELPDKFLPNVLYVLEEVAPWQVALLCPCGCKEVIQLSLLKDDDPKWALRLSENKLPSLYPSIWRTVGCQSHFFLRDGLILWV